MNVTIEKSFQFEAAHTLPFHSGKCKDLHGHSYKLHVGVRGPIQIDPQDSSGRTNSEYGMIMDFGNLSEIVKEHIIEPLDHQFLNNLKLVATTTAECLAIWMFNLIELHLPTNVKLAYVRLWETTDSFAEVTE